MPALLRCAALRRWAIALPVVPVLVAVAPPASADDPPVYQETVYRADGANADMTVTGRGYGTGRGLSLYGAERMAAAAATTPQILDFYYPGTAAGTAVDENLVRVQLTGTPTAAVTVRWVPGLEVRDAAGIVTALGGEHAAYRVVPSGTLLAVEGIDGAGGWQPITVSGGPLTFATADASPVRLVYGRTITASIAYRGTITALRGAGAAMLTVNTVSVRDFLRSTIGFQEGRASILITRVAAEDALVIALRSYLQSLRGARGAWDLVNGGPLPLGHPLDAGCVSPLRPLDGPAPCVDYRGVARYRDDTVDETYETTGEVDRTAGQVRTFGGAPISGQVTESNGGWTAADPAYPYLVAKPDPHSADEPAWTARFITGEILHRCHPELVTNGVARFSVLGRDGGGRITGLRMDALIMPGRIPVGQVYSGAALTQCLRINGVNSGLFAFPSVAEESAAPAVAVTTHGLVYTARNEGPIGIFAGGPRGLFGIDGHSRDLPAMVRLPNGDLRVFIVGTDARLYSRDLLHPDGPAVGIDAGWRSWGGSITGRPAPVVMPDRSLAVYAQGTNGRVAQAAFAPNGTFRGWADLGGPALVPGTGPGAAASADGGVIVAVNGGASGIWVRTYARGRGWGGWSSIGGSAFGSLAATSPAAGVFELFSTAATAGTAQRGVRLRRCVNGVWGVEHPLGGQFRDAPAAAYYGGRTAVVGYGADFLPYLRTHTAAGWGPWQIYG